MRISRLRALTPKAFNSCFDVILVLFFMYLIVYLIACMASLLLTSLDKPECIQLFLEKYAILWTYRSSFYNFMFYVFNRRISFVHHQKHRNFSKTISSNVLSDYSYPIPATKQPSRALPFTNPRSHLCCSLPCSPSTFYPRRSEKSLKQRDASAKASFHGHRVFPAIFVSLR